MRLLTRSDFDGLACAVFLKEAGVIDHWKFVHPKDLQDGLVEVTREDCLANVPFVEGCGLWFDHHSSEEERNAYKGKYRERVEHLQAVRISYMIIMVAESGFQDMMIYWKQWIRWTAPI